MKKVIVIIAMLLGFAVAASAQPRALGVRLGYGAELSYQHGLGTTNFVEIDLGWSSVGINGTASWDYILAEFGGGFDFYAGLGVEAEKCISATLGLIPCSEPRLQWSAETFAGLQYRLGSRTRLYFQPELSYYFTRTELVTCRTEHPLTVSLHAGLRFEL